MSKFQDWYRRRFPDMPTEPTSTIVGGALIILCGVLWFIAAIALVIYGIIAENKLMN